MEDGSKYLSPRNRGTDLESVRMGVQFIGEVLGCSNIRRNWAGSITVAGRSVRNRALLANCASWRQAGQDLD